MIYTLNFIKISTTTIYLSGDLFNATCTGSGFICLRSRSVDNSATGSTRAFLPSSHTTAPSETTTH